MKITDASFGTALDLLKEGLCVARKGWNGKGMSLELQLPSQSSGRMTLPFISMQTVQGDHVPWLASQTDMLAEDWMTVEWKSPV